ncbi:hypothetical protein Q4519_22025, partial [Motilimonas sp. 1_MG-2023]|uniref:hypothetical protein n=1 Tax=Motilimonas sp. 1_MG-2023 TaxID=3062672 RepID=UPI0026E428B1
NKTAILNKTKIKKIPYRKELKPIIHKLIQLININKNKNKLKSTLKYDKKNQTNIKIISIKTKKHNK